ncbi:IS607 family transposase [Lysinibacillus sphaericus]|uniref:IS607 family transposase n=1 Tax=Lysinibacillus sphaericus TaxID=1421 RepID=UPI001910E1EC|nr:IS607 family transposase [Lysinibacillus sphaericus]QPA56621.1 IS607 family transposase [Lysinibacillus sphaericus]QPA56639.1 IS607 family transposase [Lysinibacillus sphaericus]
MQRYSIRKFADLIDVNPQTLRNWDKEGKLKPAYVNPDTGYRYYSEEQLQEQLGKIAEEKIVVGYCRVSSKKQQADLERQVQNMKTYLLAQGKPFKIVTDIGSGIHYNKKGLNEVIDLVMDKKVSKIVVLYKDRLVRFGYELIKNICDKNNVSIEIIDHNEKSEQEEVVEDLVQIITVFSCKLQGKRSKKTKELIKELKKDD